MGKKYLKGFANCGYAPVAEDTVAAYKAGEVTKLPGASSGAPTDNKTEYTIYADDDVYDSGAEWKDTTLVITVLEADTKDIAALAGAALDESTGELKEGTFDDAPLVAFTFSALRGDFGYRLFRYPSCRCTGYKITHNTRGDNNDAQSYELTFKCSPRKIDHTIRETKDVDKGTPLTWLDTIPALPETPVVSGEG